MLGALFSGVMGLAGNIAGARAQSRAADQNFMAQLLAQQRQRDIANKQLRFQQEQAERQFDLSTATRTDALGNRTVYDEYDGFSTELAPLVQAIVNAQMAEQQRTLIDDAATNRLARGRQDSRSKTFDRLFNNVIGRLDYEQPQDMTERYIADEMAKTLYRAESDGGARGDAAVQAVRQGSPELLKYIMKDDNNNRSLMADLIEARQRGQEMGRQTRTDPEGSIISLAAQLAAAADGAPQAALRFADQTSGPDSARASALQGLLNSIGSESRNVGGALSNLQQAAGQYATRQAVDNSGIFNALGQFGNIFDSYQDKQAAAAERAATADPELDSLLRELQMAKAQSQLSTLRRRQNTL